MSNKDDRLSDCLVEYKKARQLQYDHEWYGNEIEAETFKSIADNLKELLDRGETIIPNF